MNEAASLRELAEQKEREWRSIQEKRIEALESSLRQKTQELAEQKQKMSQLRDDFKYNLSLLEERDAELAKFEENLLGSPKL
jgi:hypothetical protein